MNFQQKDALKLFLVGGAATAFALVTGLLPIWATAIAGGAAIGGLLIFAKVTVNRTRSR